MRKHKSGFTLVELLVVVAILALLLSLLIPSLSGARKSARTTICLANLRGIGQAVLLYVGDKSEFFPGVSTTGAYPASKDWFSIIYDGTSEPGSKDAPASSAKYYGTAKILYCPEDTQLQASPEFPNRPWNSPSMTPSTSISYGFNWMGLSGLDPLAWSTAVFNPGGSNGGYTSSTGGIWSANPECRPPGKPSNVGNPGETIMVVETARAPGAATSASLPIPRPRDANATCRKAANTSSSSGGVAFPWHGNTQNTWYGDLCNLVWVDGHASSEKNGKSSTAGSPWLGLYDVSIFGDGETANQRNARDRK